MNGLSSKTFAPKNSVEEEFDTSCKAEILTYAGYWDEQDSSMSEKESHLAQSSH